MEFFKKGNIYTITKITGSQDKLLGVSFLETNSSEANLEVIEWCQTRPSKTSKEEVVEQVLSGLKSVNKALGTNYKLSKIYFSPYDSPKCEVYTALIAIWIRHYDSGKEFKEV